MPEVVKKDPDSESRTTTLETEANSSTYEVKGNPPVDLQVDQVEPVGGEMVVQQEQEPQGGEGGEGEEEEEEGGEPVEVPEELKEWVEEKVRRSEERIDELGMAVLSS